jgi:L-malate glycosyltransferase
LHSIAAWSQYCSNFGEKLPLPKPIHLVHVFPGFDVGGVEIRMASIMNSLGPDWRHTILSLYPNFGAAAALRPDLDVNLLPAPKSQKPFTYPIVLRRCIKELRPNLLLTYNWGAFDATLGVGLLPFCPVIYTETGLLFEEREGFLRHRALARKIVLNRIYKTVVVSNTMKAALSSLPLKDSKLLLIRTGVDTERFRPQSKSEAKEQMGFNAEDLIMGFVGRLSAEKNVQLLLEAFAQAQLLHAKLLIIGDGALRASLEELGRKHDIADKIVFCGNVQNPMRYYACMDVFLMSSVTEQTPNALLEAMACGLPAVCTDAGDTAEMLGSASKDFIVQSNNMLAYKEAIVRLAADSQLRSHIGNLNRERCEKHYSATRMYSEYKQLYSEAAYADNGHSA